MPDTPDTLRASLPTLTQAHSWDHAPDCSFHPLQNRRGRHGVQGDCTCGLWGFRAWLAVQGQQDDTAA